MTDFKCKGGQRRRRSHAGFVFRAWRTCPKTGERLWAKDYGLKAWRIPVSRKKK